MSKMSETFYLSSNSIKSTIPTQLGQMSEMAYYFGLHSNSISSSIPTQLGQMSEMTWGFYLKSNKVPPPPHPRPYTHPPRALHHLSLTHRSRSPSTH